MPTTTTTTANITTTITTTFTTITTIITRQQHRLLTHNNNDNNSSRYIIIVVLGTEIRKAANPDDDYNAIACCERIPALLIYDIKTVSRKDSIGFIFLSSRFRIFKPNKNHKGMNFVISLNFYCI